jgi:CHAT domain-containing protein/Tfp pilus assembly protein PilF
MPPGKLTVPCGAAELKQGLIVESVVKNYEGKKAGLTAGDIILGWTRGEAKGEIESPFDLSEIETEQRPQGRVTLEGMRGGAKQKWVIGPNLWGIKARPSLSGSLLAIYREGLELARSGKIIEAAARWQAAAGRSQRHNCSWLSAWFLSRAAAALADGRQWERPDAFYKDAMEQAADAGPEVKVPLLRAWAEIFHQRGDLANAEEYYRQAGLESQRSGVENLTNANNLNDLGLVLRERGNLDKGEECHRKALGIQKELAPSSLDLASTLDNLGDVMDERGDVAKAEDYYRQSLAMREKLAPVSLDWANSLDNLGNVMDERGDVAKAENYYRQSLAMREKLAPGSLDVAYSLDNLGNVMDERGDVAKAEHYYRQSLEIREKLAPHSLDFASNLDSLGDVEAQRGDSAKAEDYYGQSLAIREKLAPGSLDLASSLFKLGEVAFARGDLAKAEEYFRQALAIREKLAPGTVSYILGSLGSVSEQRGDIAKAEIFYRRAVEIMKTLAPQSAGYAAMLAALAKIARDEQRPDEAMQLYSLAIDVLDVQLARLGGSSDLRSNFRAKRTDYYFDYADLLITQKKLDLAFQVLEQSRARTLLEMLTEARVDIRQGVNTQLLERERTLQATLSAKSNRKISLLKGKHAEEQVVAVNKEIDEILSQYRDVEGEIRISSPTYADLTQPKPLNAKEVQQELLDADTVLLEYALGENRSFVFALTPNSLDSYELPKRAEIEDTSRHVYELLTSRNRWIESETSPQRKDRVAKGEAEYQKTAAALSRTILGPVAARLEGKRLLIVADGALQYVPFALLPAPTGDASKPSVPLVAEHEIVNLPSASVLALLRQQANSRGVWPKEVAVLADPVFDKNDPRVSKAAKKKNNKMLTEPTGKGAIIPSFPEQLTRSLGDVGVGTRKAGFALPRLVFSRQEADAILETAEPGKGMEALDFQASRETALNKDLGQYRIVHFATHGLLNNEHPELSGLVLSLVSPEGKPKDGFLDLEDVYNLSLPADLVVLSACETGLGKQITGEGLVGLTRGFMYAGASHVVASLWKVDDVATAELMGRFYRGMLKEGLRPAAALRQAQLEMQKHKRWTDPYYWAAFTIQGEWK